MNEENEIEEAAPLFLIVITLFGGWLRVLLLDKNGLWLDETFSIWLAHHNIADMLQWIVKIDQHPPLYYLLLHYWVALEGDAPYTVRFLSALFGAATIPMIYLIGKRMSGVVVGLAAAFLLAVSPFNIRYGQDARMYTLLTFNASVAIYALVRLLTDPRSTRPIGSQFREYLHVLFTSGPVEPRGEEDLSNLEEASNPNGWRARIARHRWLHIQTIETDLAWVALIVFSAAALLTHNTAVLFILAINLFVLGLILFQRMKKPDSPNAFQAPSFWNWVKAQIGIFLLWSPWLITFIQQTSRVDKEFWVPKPGWDTVIRVLGSFLNEYLLVDASLVMIVWIFYGIILILGLVHYRKSISRFLFLAVLFATPFLGELIVSIRRPIFLDRTLIWITIPLFLMLAAGIAQFRFRFAILLAVVVLATNNLFSAGDYYRFWRTEEWKNAAGYVANYTQKDDLILFNATWVQIPFDYYFRDWERQYSLQVERRGVPVNLFDAGILEPKMTANDIPGLVSLVSGRERVWLVYSHNSYTDPLGIIPQTLGSEMKLALKREYYGVQVELYVAP